MPLTNTEQYLVELINRARLDPEAEAARLGTPLNADVAGPPLTGESRQVLSPNVFLDAAAEAHAQWMIDTDTFSHIGAGGSTPPERMSAAGYLFTGNWAYGENIAYWGGQPPLDLEQAVLAHHRDLWGSADHRVNLLNGDFREFGLAQAVGLFAIEGTQYTMSLLAEEFAATGNAHYLTGVAYDDSDGDDFYSPGEGIAGVQVSGNGGRFTSAAAGGYTVGVRPGQVQGSLTALSGLYRDYSANLSQGNGKLDLSWSEGALRLFTSVSLSLGAGDLAVSELRALGRDAIDLAGAEGAERLIGNAADNRLTGGGARDTLQGGDGDDLLGGGRYGDMLLGGTGDDTVTGGLGADAAWLGAGNDVFFDDTQGGPQGNDSVTGGDGDDTVYGGAGWDWISGGLGHDVLTGGKGGDALYGGDQGDTLSGQLGNDVVTGGKGADLVWLGAGNDLFLDTAQGGPFGSDTVAGGDGDDILQSAGGDDVLTGGAGADRFVLLPGAGEVRVTDYETGTDSLKIAAQHLSGALSEADLLARSALTEDGVVIAFDAGGSLTLEGLASTAGLWDDLTLFTP